MKYQNILNDKTQCTVCPRQCVLKNGQCGFCHVRQNIDGNIVFYSSQYFVDEYFEQTVLRKKL